VARTDIAGPEWEFEVGIVDMGIKGVGWEKTSKQRSKAMEKIDITVTSSKGIPWPNIDYSLNFALKSVVERISQSYCIDKARKKA